MTWFSGEELEYTNGDLGVSWAANESAYEQGEKWQHSLPIRGTRQILRKEEQIVDAQLVTARMDSEQVEMWMRRAEELTRELAQLKEELRREGLAVMSDPDE
ncbi:hypothetical protein C6369_005270 [Rhodococcus rhodochrous]|nr:hypothetical protein C6369_005270 [Rhodococcus rhodochrous]